MVCPFNNDNNNDLGCVVNSQYTKSEQVGNTILRLMFYYSTAEMDGKHR